MVLVRGSGSVRFVVLDYWLPAMRGGASLREVGLPERGHKHNVIMYIKYNFLFT